MELDPLIVKAIATGFAIMLLLAAYQKFTNLNRFRVILFEYQLLPDRVVELLTYAIPSIEFILGTAWLLGFYFDGVTATGTALLLGAYAIAIGININRNRVHIDCGCSFNRLAGSGQLLSVRLIVRNCILIITALITLLPVIDRAFGLADYMVLLATFISVTILLCAANQLFLNRAAINVWRKAND